MTTNVAFETKLNYLSLQFINKSCLRWQRPRRKSLSGAGITRKKSSFKQEHQPLGGFAAKYGGFASPPRF